MEKDYSIQFDFEGKHKHLAHITPEVLKAIDAYATTSRGQAIEGLINCEEYYIWDDATMEYAYHLWDERWKDRRWLWVDFINHNPKLSFLTGHLLRWQRMGEKAWHWGSETYREKQGRFRQFHRLIIEQFGKAASMRYTRWNNKHKDFYVFMAHLGIQRRYFSIHGLFWQDGVNLWVLSWGYPDGAEGTWVFESQDALFACVTPDGKRLEGGVPLEEHPLVERIRASNIPDL